MHIDSEGALLLDIHSFIGKSTALLGITGSGKTNTAAVIIEELLAAGLPMTIVDIEGEYWGLKERFEILVAGRSEHAELQLHPENAGALAHASIERGISVILDLSEYTEEESYTCLIEYFTTLWQHASKIKRPYQIVLEEAHEWIPEGVRTPLKTLLTRIALRGRKRGLSIILMSQRSAKVAKDVLTQTALLFLHRVVHPTDMKVYKDLIPLPSSEVEQVVSALAPGQAVVVCNHIPQVAQIRLRHTFHAGSTPEFGEASSPELRTIDQALLQELQQMIARTSPAVKDEKRLEKRIKELEALLDEKDAELVKRDEQIALLSKLTVTNNSNGSIQLPDAMQIAHASIDTATVQQVHTSALPAMPIVVEAEALKPRKIAVAPINEAKVRSLQQRITRLSPRQHQILKLLLEHDKPMTIDEIAAWMNVSSSTVHRHMLPDAIFKIGLIKQFHAGNTGIYRSAFKEMAAKEFPQADYQVLLQRILSR